MALQINTGQPVIEQPLNVDQYTSPSLTPQGTLFNCNALVALYGYGERLSGKLLYLQQTDPILALHETPEGNFLIQTQNNLILWEAPLQS